MSYSSSQFCKKYFRNKAIKKTIPFLVFIKGDSMNHKQKGIYGEKIAARELNKKGYTIVKMNYYGEESEIDIIAQKDTTIVFVEVKLRKGYQNGMPREAVDERKQRGIIKAAKQYIALHDLYENDFRFDVIEILELGEKKYFHHIENAFWEE